MSFTTYRQSGDREIALCEARDAARDKHSDVREYTRFLEAHGAKPTPPEVRAVAEFLAADVQGLPFGSMHRGAYDVRSHINNGNVISNALPSNPAVHHWMINHWTPDIEVPVTFGPNEGDLVYLADLAVEDIKSNLPQPAFLDYRPGQEWGDTQLYLLYVDPDSPYGINVWTNRQVTRRYKNIYKAWIGHEQETLDAVRALF